MDENLAENVQDVDHENDADASDAMDDCLRNPVIVRNILEYVSSKELLKISLVNKLWKYEARSVVSKRGSFIANLRSKQTGLPGRDPVAAFVSDLPKLGVIPIRGIKFDSDYNRGRHVCSFTREDLDSIHTSNLLDQLSLKTVSMKMDGPWAEFGSCPAFLLAKKVVQQFCKDLEELELMVSIEQGDYFKQVIQDCYFPRLKILKVVWLAQFEDFEIYMRELLARAPNLKMLYTDRNMNSVLHLLQGTSVDFVYTTPIRICSRFNEIAEDVIKAIKFESLQLGYFPGFNFERFNRIAPILLQASRTTIRHMHFDALLAVPLMCWGTCLENVKILQMDIGRMESIEPRILKTVLTRVFPNLDEVRVLHFNEYSHRFPPEHLNSFVERANAVLTEPVLDRAALIKSLSLNAFDPTSVPIQSLRDIFPSIEKLVISIEGVIEPTPFASIWNWLDLKELRIRGIMLRGVGNLDSVFCGIFPEEVEQLRREDDEYLKQVNIVPIMPAVTCLRNLKTFHLHDEDVRTFDGFDATSIFSKVTPLLAFARQPGLVVNLRISGPTAPPAMTHLEPYVSVTYDHPRG